MNNELSEHLIRSRGKSPDRDSPEFKEFWDWWDSLSNYEKEQEIGR